jgi:hypothetical protein
MGPARRAGGFSYFEIQRPLSTVAPHASTPAEAVQNEIAEMR